MKESERIKVRQRKEDKNEQKKNQEEEKGKKKKVFSWFNKRKENCYTL